MYSDIFYLNKNKKINLPLFNNSIIKLLLPTFTKRELTQFKKICNKNIEILTYDIIALLNVFKHFTENIDAKCYVVNKRNEF